MRTILAVSTAFVALFWEPGMIYAELPPLIPRKVLFGNPDKASPRISPDGKRLAYLAPDEGVLNVWVRTLGNQNDRVVTRDRKRGIRTYFWAQNNDQILYVQDKDGDENWHVYAVDLRSDQTRNLTPLDGVQARVIGVEPTFPNEILVAINHRDPQVHDAYRLDLGTGKLAMEAQNDERFHSWVADHAFRIRGAGKITPDGSSVLMVRDAPEADWRTLRIWGIEDSLTSDAVAFSPDGTGLYVVTSAGRSTSALCRIDLATSEERVLASDPEADVAGLLIHPTRHTVQAVRYDKERVDWQVLDSSITDDFAAIRRIQPGDFGVLNRDHADQTWLVSFDVDDGPVRYWAYDRKTKKATFLFTNRKELEDVALAKMRPIRFPARDGLTIHGYLTTPPGIPPEKLPMVLNVHGGPWHRDSWGYQPDVQWLANRGYAVLQVNFRGSTGWGKQFVNASSREWGGKMHHDLIDGVTWAIEQGIADPGRIAIFGGSYGGYATLVGLAFTPDVFCCGVDIVGPSNLITFMNTIPPYWKPWESIWWTRVGHPEKDSEFLQSRSPLFHVDEITKPLLIAQGANDPRVKRTESLQIVEALKKAGKVVEYVEYPDEGHGFARPENRLDFFAKAEKFLADHVGGRYEP